MAAIQRPGAFVLEVAELGKEVLSTFTKFVLSRKIRDLRLETLLANISITTSLLKDLGSTLNKYQYDYQIEDGLTRPTCETCKADLEQLIVLANVAKEKGGWITQGVDGAKSVATEVDTFFIFDITIGLGEKSTQFWTRLNETRGTIDALNDMIKYKILKELNQQNRLEPRQIEELKSLTTTLPRMVLGLESNEKARKQRLVVGENAKKEKIEKILTSNQNIKSSRQRPDVGEKDDFASFLSEAQADDRSEDTAIDTDIVDPFEKKKTKKKVKFASADDASIYSYNSFVSPKSRLEPSEDKIIYEEWLLSYHAPRSTVRRSWGLLGLKIKEYEEETEHWDIDPELRSQAELKAVHDFALAFTTKAKQLSSIDKAIRALPEHARDLIDWLVEDRTEATNNERFVRTWDVVAMRGKDKHAYRPGTKLIKSVKDRDWFILIRGSPLGSAERLRPDRWEDPWRAARPRRRYPRHYDKYEEREYEHERRRPHYEEYNYVPRVPGRGNARRNESENESEDEMDDGFRAGMINVGVFAGQDEAEMRMEKILREMAGKETV